ncbi:hypothetical protein OIU84_020762 [Salix udensis]|uniref:Wall-associated receptor kinase galacturonan-binding domain-containing protein n=1 Tax=Salix udensis TaxID=889485 RepID=A0AAD6KTH7_9ROSI|nr:hypothetical protein OIU84_020762 [Salix udensis]
MKPPQNRLLLTAFLLLRCATCTFSAKNCPDCGTTPVPYPFSTAPTCGDPQYKIRCNSGTLLFDTLNSSYQIMSINPSIQRLVIQPASLLPNTCVTSDYIHEGIWLNESLPFNITSDNTIMFLNCTESLLRSPLNCTSTSLCHVYVNSSKGEAPCRAASICCTFGAGGSSTAHRIRVRDTGCRAYTSFVDLDSVLPVDKWSDPGLAIRWVLPQEPVCGSQADCDGNSTCGPAANLSGAGRCYCTGGLHWDPIQGICARYATCQNDGSCGGSKKTALIAGLTSGIGLTLLVIAISVLFYKRIRRIKKAQERLAREREEILNAGGSRAAKIFTGKQIKKATNSFSKDRLLGAGGYGDVYKGILDDGTVVAVKCAKLGNTKGTDQRMVEEEKLMDVIDPVLKMKAGSLQIETVKALAFLALSCVEEKRQDRPSMKEVAEEIEYITTIATAREVEN